IMVAPNSPKALENVRIAAPKIPGKQFGNTIFQKILVLDNPSVLPTSIRFGFSCSNALLVVRYINGKETTIDAITAPFQVKIMPCPFSAIQFPIHVFFPKNTSKKNPITVGGSTIGRVNTASNNPFPYFIFAVFQAAYTPRKKVIKVDAAAVFNDNRIGVRSIFPFLSKILDYSE